MKLGLRTPNLKKSFKARTTGRLKRTINKTLNPVYGKKGAGLVKNPKRSLYNAIYSKTTFGVSDLITYRNNITDFNNMSKKDKEILSYKLNDDCIKYRETICNTTNPKEFFDSYEKLEESLKIMQQYETDVNWKGAIPSMMLGETIAIKEKCIKLLIDNIYKESNNDKEKTNKKLSKYLNCLDEENKKYLNSLN